MAIVTETTQTSNPALRIPAAKSKAKVRSKESINRFLMKHKNYEFIDGEFVKKKYAERQT